MIGFIILQYNLDEKTIKAVDSIKKMTELPYKIIIVDNCSTNNAYLAVKNLYTNSDNIITLRTETNLGFANGNNFGVKYALENFNFEYICVLNNDIYVNSKIDDRTIEDWKELNFDVLGPDIFRKDISEHQNPLANVNYSLFWLYSFYLIYNVYRLLNLLHLDEILHHMAIWTLERLNKNKNKLIEVDETQVVKKLHGSFLVFSQSFLKKFPTPFYPTTFMYLEEDFLALRCERSNSKVIYYPHLKVDHDHGSTVTTITSNNHNKRKYIFKHNSDSFKALIKYYKSNEL